MNSLKYLGKKGLRMLTLLIAVSILSFVLVSLSPIDPVQSYIGADMIRVSEEQRQQIAENWGLDQPPLTRFLKWGSNLIQGDFGTSSIYRSPVLQVIGERFIASVFLMGAAWILSGVLGFILGILAGMNQGTLLDRGIKLYCLIMASTPTFWLGLLILMVFSVGLGWFPIGLGVPAGVLHGDVEALTLVCGDLK